MRAGTSGGSSGTALTSIVAGAVILTIMLGIATASMVTGQRAISEGTSRAEADLYLTRVVGTMIPELMATGLDPTYGDGSGTELTTDRTKRSDKAAKIPSASVVPNAYIAFRKVTGGSYNSSTGQVESTYSPPIEYWFEFVDGENSGTSDADGDGIKGEGVLKRREGGSGGVTRTIARHVLGRSFAIAVDMANATATVTVELQKRMPDGTLFRHEITEHVKFRN